MKTEAAVLVELAKPLVMAELEIPTLKPGQALVEIAYSGACGSQVNEVMGLKGEDKWLPHCLGHEGTGTVLETGSSVAKVKAGDKVVLSWIKGSGIEAGGTVYKCGAKTVNAGAVTTFQRHALVSENRLTLVPAGLSMEVAVLLGCAAPTGMGARRCSWQRRSASPRTSSPRTSWRCASWRRASSWQQPSIPPVSAA